MKMKKVIITGVTGQDGSHMADYILNSTKNIVVAGVRRLSVKNHKNINHLRDHPRFRLIDLDVTDNENTANVIESEKPDFFINFAANSFVGSSWSMPVNHMQTNTMAVLYQLESIRKYAPLCRYYNAGSSEEFGNVSYTPQDENHPLNPRSPYGASKASARHLVKVYRESYDLFAVQGWLFNHEGVRRGEEFVTRKITKKIAEISHAIKKGDDFTPLELGNLESKRDWSDAEDFVGGVWLMLNQSLPKDYVLSSGTCFSIKDFVNACLDCANIPGQWIGRGVEEKFIIENYLAEDLNLNTSIIAKVNEKFYRPAEVDILQGDPSLAEKELLWQRNVKFHDLVEKMYKSDLNNFCS